MRSKQHGKRLRQEGAIKRIEASILAHKELVTLIPRIDSDINLNPQDEKKLLKKKIERAQTTVENTKENMK